MPERYLKSIRLLAECYHTFSQKSGARVRNSGLTPAQFDIIATLGNTQGMCFRELGARTLITKGTLTGVIDRLEQKALVRRHVLEDDRRMTMLHLTAAGQAEFERLFGPHIAYLKQSFVDYAVSDFVALETALANLKAALERIGLPEGVNAVEGVDTVDAVNLAKSRTRAVLGSKN